MHKKIPNEIHPGFFVIEFKNINLHYRAEKSCCF